MNELWVLGLLFRWMHILAAIVAVGGTVFVRFVVFPALEALPAEQRASLHAALRSRWARIARVAIAALLLSGFYNIASITVDYELPRWYQPLFGIKFLAASTIFGISLLLLGESQLAGSLRAKARFWLNVNIALAVLVVCLSGVLRIGAKIPRKTMPNEAHMRIMDAIGGKCIAL